MRVLRGASVCLTVVVVAGGVVVGLTEPRIGDAFRRTAVWQPHERRKAPAGTSAASPRVPLLSARFVDDSGSQVAGELTPPVGEHCSLEGFRAVIRTRA